mmetsp:Transcript_5035/g.11904  ORF Transcript_5035/g.11904 Transcript_5035/m.11904 type:complete len:215 (-) Transcript_5035:481-1125(-)
MTGTCVGQNRFSVSPVPRLPCSFQPAANSLLPRQARTISLPAHISSQQPSNAEHWPKLFLPIADRVWSRYKTTVCDHPASILETSLKFKSPMSLGNGMLLSICRPSCPCLFDPTPQTLPKLSNITVCFQPQATWTTLLPSGGFQRIVSPPICLTAASSSGMTACFPQKMQEPSIVAAAAWNTPPSASWKPSSPSPKCSVTLYATLRPFPKAHKQ